MSSIYQKFKEAALKNHAQNAVYWKSGKYWHSQSYKKFLSTVDSLADGLLKMGVQRADKIAILSENRPEWLASDLAINKLGAVSVPIHTTSNQPLIEYILKDSKSGFLFVSNPLLSRNSDFFSQFVKEQPNLKIVSFDHGSNSQISADNLFFYEDLIKISGKNFESVESELASIVYTSGTTGEPKGVMLSNQNFLNNVDGALKKFTITNQDKFLSILPLSHVLERTLGSYIAVIAGSSIAYAESIQQLSKNLKEIKPTIIIGVPRIFEKTKQKIFLNIRNKNFLIKKLFFLSLKKNDTTLIKRVADKLIYKKIRQQFGGHLRFAVSGGAAIHERILRFYNSVDIKIVEGYGLTETSPIITCNTVENRAIGTVGDVLPGVEIKIGPDKEILTKSKSVMLGYWNKPELTKEIIDGEGWFRTGDLGFIDGNKLLTIIGRKKDIIVTSNGKNIFPEKIESAINLSPYINQSIVVGHKKNHLTALIIPDQESIKENFKDQSVNIKSLIEKEVEKANLLGHDYEKVECFELLQEPFSVEKDELTPTLKIRRHVIESKYFNLIERMYK